MRALFAAGLLAVGWMMAGTVAVGGVPALPGLEADAAWGGMSRPGRSAELRIRLVAPEVSTGRAVVRIAAGAQLIESTVRLAGGAPAQVAVPVPGAEMLRIEAILPDGSHLRRDLALRLTEEPLVAVTHASSAGWPAQIARADVDASAFPFETEGYEAVDAVVVDGATLARLDAGQLKALLSYVERCGSIVALGLPPEASALLRTAAGCGGRALRLFADSSTLLDATSAALAEAPPAEVDPAALASLLPRMRGPWPLVVAGLAIYAAGIVLLIARGQSLAALIGSALAATVIVLGCASLPSLKPCLAIWAESDAVDHWGHYTAVAEVGGAGRGTRTLHLPALLQGPEPCAGADDAHGLTWRWDPTEQRYTELTFEQRLFDSTAVCWHGSFPLARPASVRRLPGRALAVTNSGDAPWPAGIAIEDDERYALAGMPAHATEVFSPARRDAIADAPAVELAVLRAEHGALLWPLELPSLGFQTAASRAFLLVHPLSAPAQPADARSSG